MTITDLANDAKKLSDLANKNIESLSDKCQEKIEIQDYYLGILRRQAILLLDLSSLLKDRNPEYISTPFIILRSLLDDFLHVLYLENHSDKKTEITKINANSFRLSFNALKDLTDSNYKHFNGKYPFYLTKKQYENLLNDFCSKEANKKYFGNLEKQKFLDFQPLTNMVKCFSISNDVDIFRDRAFYLWREFSDFVHYSNYCFEYELQNVKENFNKIDESFQYCYNTIYLTFKYFKRDLKIIFVDNNDLNKKYGIIHNC
jgi:hypothetical protein